MTQPAEHLLYADELADALRRSRGYIYAMKKAGFEMPGGTATVGEARAWLRAHPGFTTSAYFKKSTYTPAAIVEVDFSS